MAISELVKRVSELETEATDLRAACVALVPLEKAHGLAVQAQVRISLVPTTFTYQVVHWYDACMHCDVQTLADEKATLERSLATYRRTNQELRIEVDTAIRLAKETKAMVDDVRQHVTNPTAAKIIELGEKLSESRVEEMKVRAGGIQ
jgi:chromosome condensin MukBEF ATPase and DNA-binding subunit MukB